MKLFQLIIVRLGGMEMAIEFFQLHPEVEKLIEDVVRKRATVFSAGQRCEETFAADLFSRQCQPLIVADRLAAQAAARKF